MIYITGDIHGDPFRIAHFSRKMKLTDKDIIIILGDVGANYYRNQRDEAVKTILDKLAPTILCIHGNHEIRPDNIPSYTTKDWFGGKVWVEPEYPSLLFAKDGEIFDLGGQRCLVIGGAYSVDKDYRQAYGYGWWPDEQPSEETKRLVENRIGKEQIDIVLSHTCPHRYEPVEMFLTMINQESVDKSTELWLDTVEDNLFRRGYKAWYCGHWHTDKHIDRMHFLYRTFETLEVAY